jgi:hypothetical protein
MTTAKVKDLLAQLRGAANAIKAQIHEADAQIAALEEQRRALTDAPVSKADLVEYIRADIQHRADNYQWRIDKWAREWVSFSLRTGAPISQETTVLSVLGWPAP